jgi:hypothetical protein
MNRRAVFAHRSFASGNIGRERELSQRRLDVGIGEQSPASAGEIEGGPGEDRARVLRRSRGRRLPAEPSGGGGSGARLRFQAPAQMPKASHDLPIPAVDQVACRAQIVAREANPAQSSGTWVNSVSKPARKSLFSPPHSCHSRGDHRREAMQLEQTRPAPNVRCRDTCGVGVGIPGTHVYSSPVRLNNVHSRDGRGRPLRHAPASAERRRGHVARRRGLVASSTARQDARPLPRRVPCPVRAGLLPLSRG